MSSDAPQGPQQPDQLNQVPVPQNTLGTIVRQLIPTLALGAAGALTAPAGSSGGQAAGRGLLGAYEGYRSQQPTEKDLYYTERLHLTQMQHKELSQQMANRDEFRKTLTSPDEVAEFDTDPKRFFNMRMLERQRPIMIAHVARLSGVAPEDLLTTPIETLAKADQKLLSGGQVITRAEKQPDGTYQYVMRDRTGGIIGHGGEAKPPTPPSSEGATDRSFQFNQGELDKISKPIGDQAERMSRVIESINQNSPLADSLIAPELLTAMAGGAGSGLRMNEAEISRIVGGRNKWEDLKSRVMAWQADPTKPFLLQPEQRAQASRLLQAMHDRTQKKLDVLLESGQQLAASDDKHEHRRILADTHRRIAELTNMGTIGNPAGGVKLTDKQAAAVKAAREGDPFEIEGKPYVKQGDGLVPYSPKAQPTMPDVIPLD